MNVLPPRRSPSAPYWMFAILAAATLIVVTLGWVVARDFRQSAEAANQLSDRFGEGLDLIDDMLFETEEVRRILLYALHTSDANRQLEYVDQSRSAEARVKRLLENRSPILSTAGTRVARESVSAAWIAYLQTRDEVVGLILEGSLKEGVALDEALGNARFTRVRDAIADLKSSFKADAAVQVDGERTRSSRAITRLALIVLSALLLVAIGAYLVNRRASLELVLRVKSDFLTTMSHELRTPLTGVIGIADLLQAAEIPGRQRELVRLLRTNATTLLGLINNVLDYSRIDAGLMALAPRPFAVHAPVEAALDSVSELASRKGLALGYIIAPGVREIVADEDRVQQVLLNLLSNAVKYTETGHVAVHVDAAPERDDVVAVTVRVEDTGIGIPESLQQQLFHWFSQVAPPDSRRAAGTGLGLAISDRLSRLLGGSLGVESRPGEGSIFTFVFRGAARQPPPTEAVRADPLPPVRVVAALGAGVVGDQIRSLLRQWRVQLVEWTAPIDVDERCDALIVEADARRDVYDAMLCERGRGSERIPLIAVTQLRTAGDGGGAGADHVIPIPVRMQALQEALAASAKGVRPVRDSVGRAATVLPGIDASVLLVEDNESNRRVVAMMLDELGFAADQAAGGSEAIERASRRQYDVILMDVQMPDIDGLEATRRIRAQERGHRATIVALTANVLESNEAGCREAGMDAYLQKPLTLDTLERALHTATTRSMPHAS
jgi:signal transduction histidine kinase/CheY-like chemotaxis protein